MSLKLCNLKSRRKEAVAEVFPAKKTLLLYSSTPVPASLEQEDNFPTPLEIRLFFLIDWLQRRLSRENVALELVASAEDADIALVTQAEGAGEARLVLEIGTEEPDIEETGLKDYSPAELRYWMATAHYRGAVPSGKGLTDAAVALERLQSYVTRYKAQRQGNGAYARGAEHSAEIEKWRGRFLEQVDDDLNMPRALTVVWTLLIQSELPPAEKLRVLADFDEILGLALDLRGEKPEETPALPRNLPLPSQDRKATRNPVTGREGQKETGSRPNLTKPGKKQPAPPPKPVGKTGQISRVNSSRNVRSFLHEPDKADFSVSLVSRNDLPRLRATVDSVLAFSQQSKKQVELVIVDLNSAPDVVTYLETVSAGYRNVRVIFAQDLGEAAARNITFKQARGHWLLLLQTGLVLKGDLFTALSELLEQEKQPALFGLYPLRLNQDNSKYSGYAPLDVSETAERVEVEAVEGGLLCFRRALVEETGFMDEHYRSPYVLDIDYSHAFLDKDFPVIALPGLAKLVGRRSLITTYPGQGASPEEARQHQKNWEYFLKSWNIQ